MVDLTGPKNFKLALDIESKYGLAVTLHHHI